jgi:tRNA threonylcarbamoyladenosine biosynthesis protein TsaE
VALYGDLGAGKTEFVKGLCSALGVRGPVASPTFVLVHRYDARTPSGTEIIIHHLDLYRVASTTEILDLGYEEMLFGDGLCIIEWADRLGELLPSRRYDVRLEWGKEEKERLVTIEAAGIPGASSL